MDGFLRIFLLLAAVAAFLTLLKFLLPAINKIVSKFIVRYKLKSSLPASYYALLNDITLETSQGTSRIDHIVVSPYGLFVIESKHYSGWIFGSEDDAHWIRTFYRWKTRFQNPLRQNRAHIRALQELLGLDRSKFHSLVVFSGSARFRAPMPVNVTELGGLLPFIQVRTDKLIEFEEADRVAGVIRSSCLKPGRKSTTARIPSLKARQQALGSVFELGRHK
jgi:hypothetical protein